MELRKNYFVIVAAFATCQTLEQDEDAHGEADMQTDGKTHSHLIIGDSTHTALVIFEIKVSQNLIWTSEQRSKNTSV